MHRVTPPTSTVELAGFNNLTKALSFNLYDFCAARNESERLSYIQYISERYSAKKIGLRLSIGGACLLVLYALAIDWGFSVAVLWL